MSNSKSDYSTTCSASCAKLPTVIFDRLKDLDLGSTCDAVQWGLTVFQLNIKGGKVEQQHRGINKNSKRKLQKNSKQTSSKKSTL